MFIDCRNQEKFHKDVFKGVLNQIYCCNFNCIEFVLKLQEEIIHLTAFSVEKDQWLTENWLPGNAICARQFTISLINMFRCAQLKDACRACLVACAEEIKGSSLSCKPTAGPADNGRSGRLETCFDCCAKDNCTYVCGKYSAHRCLMRLCSHGESKFYLSWQSSAPEN